MSASTMCEAFQLTAAERADAAGAAAQGHRLRGELRRVRGDRAAARRRLRRPRRRPRRHGRLHARQPARLPAHRHGRDAPRRHLLLDLQHLLAGADRVRRRRRREPGDRHRAGLPRESAGGEGAGRDARARRRHRRRSSRGHDLGRGAGGDGRPRVRLRGRLARGRARGRPLPDLHLRHDRPAEGRAAHPRQHARRLAGLRRRARSRARRPQHLLPAQRPHRRPLGHPLRADDVRHLRALLPRAARDGRLLDLGQADRLGRGAADLGETEGGAGDGDGRRAGRRETRGGRVGDGDRPALGRRLHGGRRPRLDSRRAAGRMGRGRREGLLEDPLAARPRRGRIVPDRRGADAARGARVLPRDRDRDLRDLGDVGDERDGDAQPSRPDPGRDRGPADPRHRGEARRGRGDHGARPAGDEGLPQHAREDRRGAAPRTAG